MKQGVFFSVVLFHTYSNEEHCFKCSNLLLLVKFFLIDTFVTIFEIIKDFSYLLCFVTRHGDL